MKAPIDFKTFKIIVKTLIEDDEYVSQCARLHINIFEKLHSEDLLVNLVDRLFTPDDADKPYDVFSWWCFETDFGRDESMAWYEDENEVRHELNSIEQIYKYLCENLGCDINE